MRNHEKGHHYDQPSQAEMLADMETIARHVLGPKKDEETGQSRWELVDDGVSLSGKAVTDGQNYFVYERANRGGYYGLKRVKFDEKGRKFSIASQAIRSAAEEFQVNTPKS